MFSIYVCIQNTSFRVQCLHVHNVYFRPGKIVVTAIQDESPVFSKIQRIVKDSFNEVFLVVQHLDSLIINHFHCFHIKKTSSTNSFCIPLTSLVDHHCMTTHRLSDKLVVTPKYSFF